MRGGGILKPVILGIGGPRLTDEEAALFAAHPPAGVILFGRNIQDPTQLAALMAELRAVLAPEAVLMVDQEGGRVARLRPPHWQAHPAAGRLADLHARDPEAGRRAAFAHGAAIGRECRANGFDVVAAPVLDRRIPGQSDVVGDRSLGADPTAIATLGGALAEGLAAAGIIAVAKHVPGHGRALLDSHLALPRVPWNAEAWEADCAPFQALADRIPWMMTAHLLYEGLDDDTPATLSPRIIAEAIRGKVGFHGLLLSDDLGMKALTGTQVDLAERALAAGCDIVLPCGGVFAENAAILEALPARADLAARLAADRPAVTLDDTDWAAERDRLLA